MARTGAVSLKRCGISKRGSAFPLQRRGGASGGRGARAPCNYAGALSSALAMRAVLGKQQARGAGRVRRATTRSVILCFGNAGGVGKTASAGAASLKRCGISKRGSAFPLQRRGGASGGRGARLFSPPSARVPPFNNRLAFPTTEFVKIPQKFVQVIQKNTVEY